MALPGRESLTQSRTKSFNDPDRKCHLDLPHSRPMNNTAKSLFAVAIFSAIIRAADLQATDYGAKGDAQAINTQAIQRAIEAAAKTSSTVVFKPGVYLTGALFLKSGMQLRVDDGV